MALQPWQYGTIGGGIGAGILGATQGNPAKEAGKYIDQIPGAVKPYYDPYINAGRRGLGVTEGEYGSLVNDPGGKLNTIGQSYHQSPGFQFALQQALQGGANAARAGGMVGSPQHERQNMETATGLANQDYNTWLSHALGLYGEGLHGESDISHMGFEGSKDYADTVANVLGTKGTLGFQGQAQQNKNWGDTLSSIAGVVSALGAFA